MCLIIDANTASLVFRDNPHKDFVPIWKWINKKDGAIVTGGENKRELGKVGKARRRLIALHNAGKTYWESDEKVDKETSNLRKTNLCRSNDPHIIALARVSGARVLCSKDKKLHADFKNLVCTPQGCVYQKVGHKHLLNHCKGCPADRK